MDKNLLKRLVDYSFVDNELSAKRVGEVSKLLKNKREHLKEYASALKRKEKSMSVFIDVPTNNFDQYKKQLKKIYPNRKIIWNIDPSLLLGVRITEGDNVFEMSLKKSLDSIISKIGHNYD